MFEDGRGWSRRHVVTSDRPASLPIELSCAITRHYNARTVRTVRALHCARGIPTDYGCKQCSRLAAGGKCAAPMRLPLVARWQVAEWESCDITGTQSRVSHARTRATTICVSHHPITNHLFFVQLPELTPYQPETPPLIYFQRIAQLTA